MEPILFYLSNVVNYLGLTSVIDAAAIIFGLTVNSALLTLAAGFAFCSIGIIGSAYYFRNEIKNVFSNIVDFIFPQDKEIKQTQSKTKVRGIYSGPTKIEAKEQEVREQEGPTREQQVKEQMVRDQKARESRTLQQFELHNTRQGKNPQCYMEYKKSTSSFLDFNVNVEAKIVRKVSLVNHNGIPQDKYQNDWLAKRQRPIATIMEILAANLYIFFLGKDFVPKCRLAKDMRGRIWTLNKIIKGVNLNNFLLPSIKIEDQAQYVREYKQLALGLENYFHVMATVLLLGEIDIRECNWRVVDKNGKKYAAKIDDGSSFKNFSVCEFMRLGHRKELIVTKEFAGACLAVVEQYKSAKDTIKEEINKGVNMCKEFGLFKNNDSISPERYISILDKNCADLLKFSHQINVEVAIKEGDHKLFEKLLKHKESYYLLGKRSGNICHQENVFDLSSQSYNHNVLPLQSLEGLIKKRTNKDRAAMTEEERLIEEKLISVFKEARKMVRVSSTAKGRSS